MSVSAPAPMLAPRPNQGVRGKIVRLVLVSALVTGLVVGGMGIYSTYALVRRHVDEIHPLALQWSAQLVRSQLEKAQAELEGIARQAALGELLAGSASPGHPRRADDAALGGILRTGLLRTKTFAGLVVLDPQGEVLASTGSGAELSALLEMLEPKRGLDSQLLGVMRTVELRKELGGVEAPSLRVVEAERASPFPLAAIPLRDRRGTRGASVHGLIRREELAARLRADLLGADANVFVADADGRVIAAARRFAEAALEPLALQRVGDGEGSHVRFFWSVDRGLVVSCAQPLEALGLSLVSEQPAREAFSSLLHAVLWLSVIGLPLVSLCALLASRSARALVRPLRALYQGIRTAALGELAVEIPTAGARGEVGSLVTAFNEMVRRLRESRDQIETSRRALEQQNLVFQQQHETMARLSVTDALTQLHNHRFFQEQLTREIKRLSRGGESLSLLLIDIDHFKQLNDEYGHAAGDEFLRQIARTLKENVRATDLLARYGGEEFAIVTTETGLERAVCLAEKVRTAIAEASFIVDDTTCLRRATVSIGVAAYRGSRRDLFNSADAALYRAKAAGRNCVMTAEPPQDPDPGTRGGAP